ncbi:hypothetical protein [Saccharopolyspora montiporae]|uniref:hypothetical protein n=1 Tax=Saccharopolyspora montiporae TaxID=2781240 RepID=UPI00351C1AC2
MLSTATIAVLVVTGTTAGASPAVRVVASGPLDSMRTPVGLTAVGLGILGMVAGAFRKKKIQPENQRKG